MGEVFRELARQKECEVLEGKLLVDHVHMLISVPPKYAVVPSYWLPKREKCNKYCQKFRWAQKKLHGPTFLGKRIYHVSTVGRDEEVIRKYIKEQELEDRRIDQLQLFD